MHEEPLLTSAPTALQPSAQNLRQDQYSSAHQSVTTLRLRCLLGPGPWLISPSFSLKYPLWAELHPEIHELKSQSPGPQSMTIWRYNLNR